MSYLNHPVFGAQTTILLLLVADLTQKASWKVLRPVLRPMLSTSGTERALGESLRVYLAL